MAIIWMDGFDHYIPGSADVSKMLDGVYANVSSFYQILNTRPRTGGYSLYSAGINQANALRRIFGAAKTTVGLGCAFYFDSLPSTNNKHGIYTLCDTNNVPQLWVVVQPTGKVEVFRANGSAGNFADLSALLCSSADAAVVAGAYQHIEFKATAHQTAGTVEVRVNGVTVCSASGVDTVASSLVEFSMMRLISGLGSNSSGLQSGGTWMDDLFAWDDTGAQCNDFLGDRRVRTIFPDADTAVGEWTATGAASGFDCINDAAPDDETTYISALPLTGSPPAPLTSIYGLQDPPAGVGSIAAVQTYVRMRKTEAGDTNVQVSLLSSGDEAAGADRAITEAYTYWMDVHELNPNTGTPWSESSLGAAQLKIKRTV